MRFSLRALLFIVIYSPSLTTSLFRLLFFLLFRSPATFPIDVCYYIVHFSHFKLLAFRPALLMQAERKRNERKEKEMKLHILYILFNKSRFSLPFLSIHIRFRYNTMKIVSKCFLFCCFCEMLNY